MSRTHVNKVKCEHCGFQVELESKQFMPGFASPSGWLTVSESWGGTIDMTDKTHRKHADLCSPQCLRIWSASLTDVVPHPSMVD